MQQQTYEAQKAQENVVEPRRGLRSCEQTYLEKLATRAEEDDMDTTKGRRYAQRFQQEQRIQDARHTTRMSHP